MGYGDAYVYCAIIGKEQVEKITIIRREIQEIQKEIDPILEDMKINPIPSPERGKIGLALMEQQDEKYGEIITVCRNPIAFDLVADDSWHEAYDRCSRYNFRPVPVQEFLKGVQDKFWKNPAIFAQHINGYCICLPSHYDTDDEFLAELNIPPRHG
jgi:hypothetical protein